MEKAYCENLMSITKIVFSFVLILFCQMACGQDGIERRKVLNSFEDGSVLRERIKYLDKDTLEERIYHDNGNLQSIKQWYNGRLNGKSLVYDYEGPLVFREFYENHKLHGEFTCYYKNGNIQRTQHYQKGHEVDTTIYYNEVGDIESQEIFEIPCMFGDNTCSKTVVKYSKGKPSYSYKVIDGRQSKDHHVINQALYNLEFKKEEEVSSLEKGKSLYVKYCAACHGVNNPIVGPALKPLVKERENNVVFDLYTGSKMHPKTPLNKEEYNSLLEYIRRQ